jgi:hypothetical protein
MQKMQVLQQRTLMRLSEDETALAVLSLQKALTEYNAARSLQAAAGRQPRPAHGPMKANDLL